MAATDFVTESQLDSLVTNIATAVKANTTAIGTKTDDTTVNAHISDTTAAHAASAVSYNGGTGISATTVEDALDELANEKLDKSGGTVTGVVSFSSQPSGILASSISIADVAGDYLATTVEGALAEVRVVADDAADSAALSAVINDATVNTSNAWSSQKISDEISTSISSLIDGAPGALDTLNELAAAINDDASFTTTITTALGFRLRVDAAQSFTSPQKLQGRTNLGVIASVVDFAANFNAAVA